MALRKALIPRYPEVRDFQLADYKVRILNGGTGATTRVLLSDVVAGRADVASLTLPEARATMDAYFSAYPDVAAWLRDRTSTPAG